ncbi:Ms family protein [Megaselia abdita]
MSSSQRIISAIFLAGLVILATINSASAAPQTSPLCEPGIIEEMPPHIKKVCLALENSNQLTNALSTYLKNEATALSLKNDEFIPSNFKRTDVDHVFLRFGRRR